MDTIQKLFRFLDESPTCYHAAANVLTALKEAGAVELRESEPWKLERGSLYAVERGDSAVIAFRVPEEPFRGFLLAAVCTPITYFGVYHLVVRYRRIKAALKAKRMAQKAEKTKAE